MKDLRTEYLTPQEMDLALRLLTQENRLAMELCIATGLRIGDALQIRTDRLRQRMTIREQKTGKSRRIYIPAGLLEKLQRQAGTVWVFPGARDPVGKHRTRQAVWKDVKRAAKAARLPANAGTHSARKVYAVGVAAARGMAAAQAALNHDDPTVTMIYALADKLRQNAPTAPPPRRPRGGSGERKAARQVEKR